MSGVDNYKAQLNQVEAALNLDPNNEELLKLKEDLKEVIELSLDLQGESYSERASTSSEKFTFTLPTTHKYKVGEKCLAPHPRKKIVCEAIVHDILAESEMVIVKFHGTDETELCTLSSLKPVLKMGNVETESSKFKGKLLSKKERITQLRDYKKKRNLKKKMRLKEKEAESEVSKNKWQDFNKKVFSKTTKGKVKKSIFASPEGLDGKVGIGTCGVADKQMTKYENGAKYNARNLVPKKNLLPW